MVTVLIFIAVISVFCASLLTVVTFEKKLTRRTAAIAELKTSTDSLLNYAAAQARGNSALVPLGIKMLPTDFFSSDSAKASLVVPSSQEIYASPLYLIPNPLNNDLFKIDPNAPINRNDDLRDKNVFRYLCFFAAKSAVKDPSKPSTQINEYSVMVMERRLFSVFNYLAFFDVAQFRISNPGSNIVLDGPIQSNQGIRFDVQGQPSTVEIQSTMQTPGTLSFNGYTSAKKFMMTDGTKNSDGTPFMIDMLKPGTTSLLQSSDGTAFNTFANTTTKGMLKTGAVGGTDIQLDGLNYVAAEDASQASIPDKFKLANNRRIDPPNPELKATTDALNGDGRIAEDAKTAYQASLYTYVESNGTVTVFTNQTDAAAYKANTSDAARAAWKANNTSKYIAPSETNGFVNTPYVERYNDGGTDYTSASKNTDLARNAIFDAQQKQTVAMIDVDLGKLRDKVNSGKLMMADGITPWKTDSTNGWNGVLYVDVANPTGRPTAVPVKDSVSKKFVGPVPLLSPLGIPLLDSLGKPLVVIKPDDSITADTAIKVPLPSLNVTGTAQAWDNKASISDTGLTGVRIKNAAEVPGSRIGDAGFTLATNTATYTVGSVNADGDMKTGTTSLQDGQTKESDDLVAADKVTKAIPVAIFSDKNVVLSGDFANSAYDLKLYVPKPASKPTGMSQKLYDNWPFSTSLPSEGQRLGTNAGTNGQYFYQDSPTNIFMELNAAFMIGDDDSSNKGIHTILSYLQPFNPNSGKAYDPTKDTLRMRGSIIGIYKSRYFKAPAGSFNDYYIAPQRTFGYSTLLKKGKMPPAAPTISSYRRMRQQTITPADYAALKAIPNNVTTDADKKSAIDSWLSVIGTKY